MACLAFVSLFLVSTCLAQIAAATEQVKRDEEYWTERAYPTQVEVYDGRNVTTGDKFHSISRRMSYKEFNKVMQCPPEQPDLLYSGSYQLMKLVPPTRDSLQFFCAYAETRCEPFKKCRERVASIRRAEAGGKGGNKYKEDGLEHLVDVPTNMRLVHFFAGRRSASLDWPWGRHRMRLKSNTAPNHAFYLPIHFVQNMIYDLPTAFMFFSEELPVLLFNFPFPVFSSTASLEFADMPWPWPQHFEDHLLHKHINLRQKFDFVEKMKSGSQDLNDRAVRFNHSKLHEPLVAWKEKIPRALCLTGITPIRQVIIDVAAARPDLIEAHFTDWGLLQPWNPLSEEEPYERPNSGEEEKLGNNSTAAAPASAPGFLSHIDRLKAPNNRAVHDEASKYKYLIVPLGRAGKATAGRLAFFLAHAGSVVLLQHSQHSYHFSHRLKPWVHYVPILNSGADVAEKIEWLREHDNLAQQIAANGLAFGKSYLRFEDYLCYAAYAVHTLGTLQAAHSNDSFVFDPEEFPTSLHQNTINKYLTGNETLMSSDP